MEVAATFARSNWQQVKELHCSRLDEHFPIAKDALAWFSAYKLGELESEELILEIELATSQRTAVQQARWTSL